MKALPILNPRHSKIIEQPAEPAAGPHLMKGDVWYDTHTGDTHVWTGTCWMTIDYGD